ncbi:hypothetical protein A3F66_04025 [candidate division TM6 bacterium RIFCSPHIGHO2_12_FULL_32_22]|nr:MAG: hypothetical protein A3F66_04025 [candidate division TM6 bacterium RIFCSPHIGHO2_12_FULL_32_22]
MKYLLKYLFFLFPIAIIASETGSVSEVINQFYHPYELWDIVEEKLFPYGSLELDPDDVIRGEGGYNFVYLDPDRANRIFERLNKNYTILKKIYQDCHDYSEVDLNKLIIPEMFGFLNDEYKIHITVKPEYLKWVIRQILDLYKDSNFDISAPIFKVTQEPYKTMEGQRTIPSIVFYADNYKNAQFIYDKLKLLNGYSEIATGELLKHNLGGPVVWWAGGGADYKPGGKYDLESWACRGIYDRIYGPDQAYYRGQRNLR